ncbi:hypothetical protein [Siminovitchia terrae]|nr:hypothetical protein [Siminovitchia terrae]
MNQFVFGVGVNPTLKRRIFYRLTLFSRSLPLFVSGEMNAYWYSIQS